MLRETRYRKEALITTSKIVIPRPYCHSRLFFALFCLFFTRLFYHLLGFITSECKNKPILFLPSNKTDFSCLKPSNKSKDTSEITVLKKPESDTQVFVIFLIYGITLSSILLAIFPKKTANKRLIMTKNNPR